MEQKLGKNLNWEYVESELRGLDIFDYEKESRQLAKKLFGAAVWPQEDLLTEAERLLIMLVHLRMELFKIRCKICSQMVKLSQFTQN